MDRTSSVYLGMAANLLPGYRSDWDPSSGKLNILHSGLQSPTQPQIGSSIVGLGSWAMPIVTLHETPESLLNDLLCVHFVEHELDNPSPFLPAGELMLHGREGVAARRNLSKVLGVSLEAEQGLAYALVTLKRIDGTLCHSTNINGMVAKIDPINPSPECLLQDGFLRDLSRLRHDPEKAVENSTFLNAQMANNYLQAFETWGTHYVSEIEMGDCLIQVMAYQRPRFEQMRNRLQNYGKRLEGAKALLFSSYTTPALGSPLGYVAQYGHILCQSNCEAFRESLQDNAWYDPVMAENNSLFSLFNERSKIDLDVLDQSFTGQVQIGSTLTSLTTFTEFYRTQAWRRVFKAAMASLYGERITPNFFDHTLPDFNALLPQQNNRLVSLIATEQINLFKPRLDLVSLELLVPEQVKTLTTYGIVVGATGKERDLPGQELNLFGYILDFRSQEQPVTLRVDRKMLKSLVIGCNQFLGALRLECHITQTSLLIVDGLCYEVDDDKRVHVTKDVRKAPEVGHLALLRNSLIMAINYSQAIVAALSSASECCDTPVGLAREHLLWLGQIMSSATGDDELVLLGLSALDSARFVVDSQQGCLVPILPPDAYEDYLHRILDQVSETLREEEHATQLFELRQAQERAVDMAQALNNNIIESGRLVAETLKIELARQQDINQSLKQLTERLQIEAGQQLTTLSGLKNDLLIQQSEVDSAVASYKAAVEGWRTRETLSFALDVAVNLFNAVTLVVPQSSVSSVANLGARALQIKKTLSALDCMYKVYGDVHKHMDTLDNARRAMNELEGFFGDTELLGWDEMSISFTHLIGLGGDDPKIKRSAEALSAAFQILVARGKALVCSKVRLHQINREIYSNEEQRQNCARQLERLGHLNQQLHPALVSDLDRAEIDLVGLTAQLDSMRLETLGTFATAFRQQDQALQYQNLQPATQLADFSLSGVLAARIQQSRATVAARGALAQYPVSTYSDLVYELRDVPIRFLTNGAHYSIVIDPSTPRFNRYVTTRVKAVVVELEGISGSDSGVYLLTLNFSDSPFVDRDVQRQIRLFNTPQRERTYEYDANSDLPLFSDDGHSWSEGVSQVSPFGEWQVQLRPTQSNQGLKFLKPTVTLRLRFKLEARVIDQPLLKQAEFSGVTRQLLTATAPSFNNQVSAMYDLGTVTNGWDVVFCMARQSLNQALLKEFTLQAEAKSQLTHLVFTVRNKIRGNKYSIKNVSLDLGYPALSFSFNSGSEAIVEVNFAVSNGRIAFCEQAGDLAPICDPEEDIPAATLKGVIKLEQVKSCIAEGAESHDILSVILDLGKGDYELMEQASLGVEDFEDINNAVKSHFREQALVFLLSTLDLRNISQLKDMQPNSMRMRLHQAPSGSETLQLFIQTGERELLNSSQCSLNALEEPLPLGSDCALIVRSELFFASILPQSLKKQQWSLRGVTEPTPATGVLMKSSHSVFTQAGIRVSDIHMDDIISPSAGGNMGRTISLPNSYVDWNLEGMTLAPSREGSISLSLKDKNQSIPYNITTTTCGTFSCTDKVRTEDSVYQSTIISSLPLSIIGKGREQSVKIDNVQANVAVSGNFSGGGSSSSNDIKERVNDVVNAQVPEKVRQQLQFDIDAISVFALKNLLFPQGDYIELCEAKLPGDLLLVGVFKNT
jgi:hypothetical protein